MKLSERLAVLANTVGHFGMPRSDVVMELFGMARHAQELETITSDAMRAAEKEKRTVIRAALDKAMAEAEICLQRCRRFGLDPYEVEQYVGRLVVVGRRYSVRRGLDVAMPQLMRQALDEAFANLAEVGLWARFLNMPAEAFEPFIRNVPNLPKGSA